MIVGVFGLGHLDRVEYRNYDYVARTLETYEAATHIITGGGVGVEQLALRWASEMGLEHDTVPPDMRNASMKSYDVFRQRNVDILGKIELAVLIWDGKGRFYADFLYDACNLKKPVHIYPVE